MSNQTKVTFLLGAGASAETLPVVKNIPKRLEGFSENREKWAKLPDEPLSPYEDNMTQHQLFREFFEEVDSLVKASQNHRSIDTYAKKLSIRGNKTKLFKLKAILTCFLTVLQSQNPVDLRYDSFFAALLDPKKKLKLPNNINVISWNYDFQLEKAFAEYVDNKDLVSIQQKLKVLPSEYIEDNSDPSVFKLNGTAAVYFDAKSTIRNPLDIIGEENFIDDKEAVRKAIGLYTQISRNPRKYEPLLSFAWEEQAGFNEKVIENTINHTKDTDILVVIGYSFPYFNREVDREIIGKMSQLKRVYFQAPKKDVNEIKERFRAIRGLKEEFKHTITGLEQFFLPPEL